MATATSTPVKSVTPAMVGPKPVNFTNKPEVLAAIAEVKRLKDLEREGERAKALRKALEENVILPALGDAERAIVRGVNVLTLSSLRHTDLFDHDLLLATAPEIYTLIHSRKPYRFVQYS